MKKMLCLLLAMLCLLPVLALADDVLYNVMIGGVQVTPENMDNVLSDGKVQFIPGETANTIRLKNASIVGTENTPNGIGYYDLDKPLILEFEGENTVKSYDSPYHSLSAIESGNSLTIRETGSGGSLTASAVRSNETNQEGCYGIRVSDVGGKLRIESGTITAIASNTGRSIYAGGIFTNCDIEIAGGTVKAYCNHNGTSESTTGWLESGAAIYTEGNYCTISITGKDTVVEAYAGKAANASCGIGTAPDTSIVITDATVKAVGGWGQDSYGLGVGFDGNITIGGSANVTAKGGKGEAWYTDESNPVPASEGASYGIGSRNTVTIGGSATVNATAGEAKVQSLGIGGNQNVTISGSANVTAKGGTAGGTSYGVGSDGKLTISDSANVTANGGAADVMSYGVGTIEGIDILDSASLKAAAGSGLISAIGVGTNGDMTVDAGVTLEAEGSTYAAGVLNGTTTVKGTPVLTVQERTGGRKNVPQIDWANDENKKYIYLKIQPGVLADDLAAGLPQTGDASSLIGWVCLLAASGAGLKIRRRR